MPARRALTWSLFVLSFACGGSSHEPSGSARDAGAGAGGGTAGVGGVAGGPSAGNGGTDAAAPDAASDGGSNADANVDAKPPTDGPVTAVLGARCALQDRLGYVAIQRLDLGANPFYLASFLYTEKNPQLGNVTIDDGTCRFHKASTAPFAPVRPKDLRVVVSAGGKDQSFRASAQNGELEGAITLPGDTFAVELTWGNNHVRVPAMQVPAALGALTGHLEGEYQQPQRLDFMWTAVNDDARVYTLIPINHHAGGPTFTECSTPTTRGSLSVSKELLTPLSVITGLEFQSIDHVRFAAAQTPAGCIELRFYTQMQGFPL